MYILAVSIFNEIKFYSRCDVFILEGVDFPTDAKYNVDFDDGTELEKVPFNTNLNAGKDYIERKNGEDISYVYVASVVHPKGYYVGNTYRVDMVIWNLVNFVNVSQQHSIYEVLYNVSNFVQWIEVKGNKSFYHSGFMSKRNYYPIENMLLFNISFDYGSHLIYRYEFGDGNFTESGLTSESRYRYSEPGMYNVFVNISNPRSSWTHKQQINIQRRVANVSLSTTSPRARNKTFTFNIDPGTLGTDMCCVLDFVDEEADENRFYFFGHQERCIEAYENQWNAYTEGCIQRHGFNI